MMDTDSEVGFHKGYSSTCAHAFREQDREQPLQTIIESLLAGLPAHLCHQDY